MTKRIIAYGVMLLAIGAYVGCSNSTQFSRNVEGTGAPPDLPESGSDPLSPPIEEMPEGYIPTLTSQTFTQGTVSDFVDIIWMIDNSGSMSNNQTAISKNASRFTDLLTTAKVDFKLMIVTSDPDHPMPDVCKDRIISTANDNAADFATCAVIGTSGSGHEEGLESVHRALVQKSTFLRPEADLQIIYVSDEEDEPDSGSWYGHVSGHEAELTTLIDQLSASKDEPEAALTDDAIAHNRPTTHLADDGHDWDGTYTYVPTVANHVDFLSKLPLSEGSKIRTHAIVTENLNGADECHKRNQTEEIGKRYMMVAEDPVIGGSTTDIVGGTISGTCGDWSGTMDRLALQAAGLDSCFVLDRTPITYSSSIQSVKVDGVAVSYKYYPYGNKICLSVVPTTGQKIVVTYYY